MVLFKTSKNIYQLFLIVEKYIKDFWKYIKFKLGPKENIGFWGDVWMGETLLREVYSNIDRLTLDLQALVFNCFDNSSNCWDSRLRMNSNDWEVGELLGLIETLGDFFFFFFQINILGDFSPSQNKEDRWG